MGVVVDNLDRLVAGGWITVLLTVISFSMAFAIGVLVAAMRVSPVGVLRGVGAAYVGTVRNTPLAVLFVIFFFGFPDVGIRYSAFTSAVIVLSIYTGSFVAETVRSGINAVARGQGEAARSLGLTFPQVLITVVLPQATRTVVAPLGSIFIALIKNSSLAAIISVADLTQTAKVLVNETAEPIPIFIGVALAYLLLTIPSGVLVNWIEQKVAIRR